MLKLEREDVGRRVRLRIGRIARLLNREWASTYPYEIVDDLTGNHLATLDSYGSVYGDVLNPHKYDAIAWVDEPLLNQTRSKDLRDEFAMSVIASIVGNQDYYEMPNPDKVKWVDRVAQYAYVFADAMIKAREVK